MRNRHNTPLNLSRVTTLEVHGPRCSGHPLEKTGNPSAQHHQEHRREPAYVPRNSTSPWTVPATLFGSENQTWQRFAVDKGFKLLGYFRISEGRPSWKSSQQRIPSAANRFFSDALWRSENKGLLESERDVCSDRLTLWKVSIARVFHRIPSSL